MRVRTRYVDECFCPALTVLGDAYSLAGIKWYSMVPGLPRMVPDLCNDEATPAVLAWLGRMTERPAVRQLDRFRPA